MRSVGIFVDFGVPSVECVESCYSIRQKPLSILINDKRKAATEH